MQFEATKHSSTWPAFFLFLLTVTILPQGITNPTTMPKAWMMSLFTVVALIWYLINSVSKSRKIGRNTSSYHMHYLPQLFFSFSSVTLIVSIWLNSDSLNWSIFGNEQRRTGYIYYLGLTVIALIFARKSVGSLLQKSSILLLAFSNLAVTFYTILQFQGLDFVSYQTYYSSPSSFLGNPNFVSGFIGFSCWSHLIFLSYSTHRVQRFFHYIFTALALSSNIYVLFLNKSLSGPLAIISSIFCLTVTILVYKIAIRTKWIISKKNLASALAFTILLPLVTSSFLAISKKLEGFVALLGSETRLVYWRVSIRMFMDAPIFGKGPEAFASNFLHYRTKEDLSLIGRNQNVDSSHNLSLEILSIGGLTLFLSLILFFFLGIKGSIELLLNFDEIRNKSERQFNVNCIPFMLIIGFISQSLVNVSNIAICAWGFALIAQGISHIEVRSKTNYSAGKPRKVSVKIMSKIKRTVESFAESVVSKVLWKIILSVTIVISSFGLVGYSRMLINEWKFQEAVLARDGEQMIRIAKSWPENERIILGLGNSLDQSGFKFESLDILLHGSRVFPRNIDFWILISRNLVASPNQVKNANEKILEIDPLYLVKN
jgi:O-antigen ligase